VNLSTRGRARFCNPCDGATQSQHANPNADALLHGTSALLVTINVDVSIDHHFQPLKISFIVRLPVAGVSSFFPDPGAFFS